MTHPRRIISAVLAVAMMIAGAVGVNLRTHLGSVQATFRMAVDTAGDGQVFTSERGGYSEANSSRFPMQHGDGMRSYSALLHPGRALKTVRLDPGAGTGRVQIESIAFSWRGQDVRLTGAGLRKSVRPLNQLEMVPGDQGVSLQSTGTDPYLEIAVPEGLASAMAFRAKAGLLLMVIAIAGLLWLSFMARRDALALIRETFRLGNWRLLLIATPVGLVLLDLLGYGCEGLCSPRGIGFGLLLLAGSLGMAVVGQVLLRLLRVDTATLRPRLFLSLLTGQAALVFYIAVRSAIHARATFLPITAAELVVIVAAAAALLLRDAHATRSARPVGHVRSVRPGWLWIELSLLAATCLVIGDRELPRLVMLSSDPDTHAYFARQLELGGGVPWGGANAFHYPMGTALLGFLWAKLSFLDVRNAVTALPVLQAFLAALVLAEAFALRVRANAPVLLLFLTGLGATAAGFLIPLYSNYAHMEGAGRQMAMATFALIPALLIARRNAAPFSLATLTLLSLFVLVVLNPINLVLPLLLLAGYLLHRVLQTGQLGWGAVVPAALVPLLLVDPFYFELLAGTGAPVSRFTLDDALQSMPAAVVFSQWRGALAVGPLEFLVGNTRFLPAQAPVFIAMVAILLPLLWWLRRWPLRRVGRYAVVAVFMLAALWAADALFDSVVDDRRFYLLAPYYWLSLAQGKILLVTALLLAVSLELLRGRWVLMVPIAFSAVAIMGTAVAMHRTQAFMESPRVDYCGSLGCIETDDVAVLREFEALYLDGKLRPGRVLLPNSRHSAHREKWTFPITAARAVPFFAMPPPAFFYYQGDADYTTANYMIHVCDHFDRQWLREQDIAYVFLPARRGAACMEGMDNLSRSLPVLVRHGDSMIVELR